MQPAICQRTSVGIFPLLRTPGFYLAAEPSAPEDGIFGAGAHSDYGMLTLLKTDDVPGLQVRATPR